MYKRVKVTPFLLNDNPCVSTSVSAFDISTLANTRCTHHENGRDSPRYIAGNLELQKMQILLLGFKSIELQLHASLCGAKASHRSGYGTVSFCGEAAKVRRIRLSLSPRSVDAHRWSQKACFLHGKSWLGALAKL